MYKLGADTNTRVKGKEFHIMTEMYSKGVLSVRAWVPQWGAEKNSDGTRSNRQAYDYSPWFIGHTDPGQLTDAVLDTMVAAAAAEGITEPEDFHDWLGTKGYTPFTSGAEDVFVAMLPDRQ